MAIKANDFDGHQWSQALWPVTALIGDEAFFITRLGDLWRKFGRAQGFSERVVIDQSEADPAARLRDEREALSLFSDQGLVELRLNKTVLDAQLRTAIDAWIQQTPDDKRLLILGPALGKAETNQDWVKQLNQRQAWIDAVTVGSAQFGRWLDGELARQQIELAPDAKTAVISHTEGNLLAAGQVLERLKLVQPDLLSGSTLGLDAVMEALTQSARYTVYDLVDHALRADVLGLNRIADLLKAEGIDAMSALWATSREVDLLLQIRHRIDQGESTNQAISALRVWRSREGLVRAAVNRLSLIQLRRLLSLCHETDRSIKGASAEPAWLMLKDVLLGLAGHAMTR
jgi:DNA polymerase III subunit delta